MEGGVATLVLHRPDKLNALAGPMRQELLEGLRRAAADPAVRVIAVRGEGRAFCAGGDVDAMIAMKEAGRGPEGVLERMEVGVAVVREIRSAPQPVVALVHGVAAGAGAAVACAADLVWAASDARFFFSWGSLGLHPDWGASWTLARRVGPSRALEWCTSGQAVGAEAALAAGLATRISEPSEWSTGLAALAGSPPVAVAELKRSLFAAGGRDVDAGLAAELEAQAKCWAADECGEGLAAFAARRRKP